jgi:cytochrome c oxidase subunit 4
VSHPSNSSNETVKHHSHRAEYFKIFVVLTVLTIVELVVPALDISYALKAISLTLLALGKACVVAYSYMHLKEETKWLKAIAMVPISAFIFAVVLILDSLYR